MTTLTGSAIDDSLAGGAGNDLLLGLAGNDTLIGNDGDDTVKGGSGNDSVDGGAGIDLMAGGAGDDTYRVENTLDKTSELAGEGRDTIVSDVAWTMSRNFEDMILTGSANINGNGNLQDNVITGNDGNNRLRGNAGNDTLFGGIGNDTLDGGDGADSLDGGANDDTYIVDSPADSIVEAAGNGFDTVIASLDFTLGANLESLVLAKGGGIQAMGNDSANSLTGNELANQLDGGDGRDSLYGGYGNDTLDGGVGQDRLAGGADDDQYVIDSVGDVIIEQYGNGYDSALVSVTITLVANVEAATLVGATSLSLNGNELNNSLTGNTAGNTLTGYYGDDTLDGGDGDDLVSGDDGADLLLGGYGNDVLDGSHGVDFLVAGKGIDTMFGGAGNDTLYGVGGADQLYGGTGDDYYAVWSDVLVFEYAGEGTDTVMTDRNYTLTDHVENLSARGGFAVGSITGNSLANVMTGNQLANRIEGLDGNDTLLGGFGNDTLVGGAGVDSLDGGANDDTYVMDSLTDAIVETAGNGFDTVIASLDFTLGANLEALVLAAGSGIHATGNAAANSLTGNELPNQLDGGDGNDTLNGDSGKDTLAGGNDDDVLRGGTGADLLVGGTGNDTLTGEFGADVFWFDNAPSATTNLDHVTDFIIGTDMFWLSQTAFTGAGAPGALAATAFVNGTNAADASDRVIYDSATGALYYDADGTGATAKVQFAVLDNHAAVTAAHFVIV